MKPSVRYCLLVIIITVFSCEKSDKFPPPTITSFYPTSATEDDPVKISGKFIGVTKVLFGGVSAKSIQVVSESEILAVVGAGNSGSISVETIGGSFELPGFNYYTAQTYQMAGNCVYVSYGYPAIIADTAQRPHYYAIETCSIQVFKSNPNDSIRNYLDSYNNPINPKMSPYADSTDYIRISGVGVDPFFGNASNGGLNCFNFIKGGHIIYAKLIDNSFVIPTQQPYGGSIRIWGNGTLINNKLTINYTSDYRGNDKMATIKSQ
jgi:hypothetical protein